VESCFWRSKIVSWCPGRNRTCELLPRRTDSHPQPIGNVPIPFVRCRVMTPGQGWGVRRAAGHPWSSGPTFGWRGGAFSPDVRVRSASADMRKRCATRPRRPGRRASPGWIPRPTCTSGTSTRTTGSRRTHGIRGGGGPGPTSGEPADPRLNALFEWLVEEAERRGALELHGRFLVEGPELVDPDSETAS
jgi:hypothetical protein